MRIESSVRTGASYSPDTFFIDTNNYHKKPFLSENNHYAQYVSEEEVNSSNEALQARLAHMEYGEDICKIAREYFAADSSRIDRFIGHIKVIALHRKNRRLMDKAIGTAIKRKGGLVYMVTEDMFKMLPLLCGQNKQTFESYLAARL